MSKNKRQNREKKKRQRLAKEKRRGLREQSVGVIRGIARRIGNGPLGLAKHWPQPWALARECYDNVLEMIRLEGGSGLSGWTFHARTRPGVGDYVFTTPHAVWHNPQDGSIVDVTPYPDPYHAPTMEDGGVVFLVDSSADPVSIADGVDISPPLRFFAVGESPVLAEYVAGLNEREAVKFECDKQAVLAREGR